ncbi:MAG: glycosyltransferase family 2 protein [Planctomycetaceae bacterium]|nr:glycosyltransferase family 2 protein [Planctomycetaceae bacterium]
MRESRIQPTTAAGQERPPRPVGRAGGISVIVPAAPWDSEWKRLLPDLAPLSGEDEILIVGTQPEPADFQELVTGCRLAARVRWLPAPQGRATQMNHGASAAAGRWLWFLHADSRMLPDAVEALDAALTHQPDALHYFALRFLQDGPAGMTLNELGVRFRSRVLRMPFGDQGFCLRRDLFDSLGGYEETASYGEDHLLVWAARRRGIAVLGVSSAIQTSARKYRAGGWFRTTARHLRLTFAQAVPQFCLLLRERFRLRSATSQPLPRETPLRRRNSPTKEDRPE